ARGGNLNIPPSPPNISPPNSDSSLMEQNSNSSIARNFGQIPEINDLPSERNIGVAATHEPAGSSDSFSDSTNKKRNVSFDASDSATSSAAETAAKTHEIDIRSPTREVETQSDKNTREIETQSNPATREIETQSSPETIDASTDANINPTTHESSTQSIPETIDAATDAHIATTVDGITQTNFGQIIPNWKGKNYLKKLPIIRRVRETQTRTPVLSASTQPGWDIPPESPNLSIRNLENIDIPPEKPKAKKLEIVKQTNVNIDPIVKKLSTVRQPPLDIAPAKKVLSFAKQPSQDIAPVKKILSFAKQPNQEIAPAEKSDGGVQTEPIVDDLVDEVTTLEPATHEIIEAPPPIITALEGSQTPVWNFKNASSNLRSIIKPLKGRKNLTIKKIDASAITTPRRGRSRLALTVKPEKPINLRPLRGKKNAVKMTAGLGEEAVAVRSKTTPFKIDGVNEIVLPTPQMPKTPEIPKTSITSPAGRGKRQKKKSQAMQEYENERAATRRYRKAEVVRSEANRATWIPSGRRVRQLPNKEETNTDAKRRKK
ncbi:MAG TPA: hypothetical protein VIY47_05205, partial [Ignavibacteriaceae bacterium]